MASTELNHTRLRIEISRRDKSVASLADDVLSGLSANPKTLSPKYFYDTTGSQLFEQICELPEYYPTRTERAILERYAADIAECCEHGTTVIELGSGSAAKTRILIEAFLQRFQELDYHPIDISKSALVNSSQDLLRDYPKLRITGFVSDYDTALEALENGHFTSKLLLFLGSNIGNFEKAEADAFLKKLSTTMSENDRLLLGADLIKDASILEPAYDDAAGVTAAFNQNLLVRINRELDGDFDLEKFRHRAFLNKQLGRMEMHLESLDAQIVTVNDLNRRFYFAKGETIHTENSYKYSLPQLESLALRNGFYLKKSWLDEKQWFSLNLLQPLDD